MDAKNDVVCLGYPDSAAGSSTSISSSIDAVFTVKLILNTKETGRYGREQGERDKGSKTV
jgi:hypothetical protein